MNCTREELDTLQRANELVSQHSNYATLLDLLEDIKAGANPDLPRPVRDLLNYLFD